MKVLEIAPSFAVQDLPDLTDRIEKMGLTEEYSAYRDRFLAWRRGSFSGARGDLNASDLEKKTGFGFWYPSTAVWKFRRTLSYWIAVTFLEGSLFFAVSSFCSCYPEALGNYKMAMTTYGLIGGKVNFLICTYFMCLETINLNITSLRSTNDPNRVEEGGAQASGNKFDDFRYWPFCYNRAITNLKNVGAGPWPYLASLIYFIGVLIFGVGLVAEFVPIPEGVAHWTKLISFFVGSLCFVFGGLAECIENDVFRSYQCRVGWWGALLNFIGGLLFLFGSIIDFFHGMDYWGNFLFAVGSLVFALGSTAMCLMWKDEQFGLTFFAALNTLGGPNGRPLVVQGSHGQVQEEPTFSWRGSAFLMIYIWAATLSVYNFTTSLEVEIEENMSRTYIYTTAFQNLLPCIFAHALLGLNSAVVHAPKGQPFRQLYFGCRFLAMLMVVFGIAQLAQTLMGATRPCNTSVSVFTKIM